MIAEARPVHHELSRFVVLWGVALWHIGLAYGLVFHPDAMMVTHVRGALELPASVFATIGLCALAGPLVERRGTFKSQCLGLALSCGQQWLVFVHALSVYRVVDAGRYPDGYEPADPHMFIFFDQGAWLLIALVHMVALFNGYLVQMACAAYRGARWTANAAARRCVIAWSRYRST